MAFGGQMHDGIGLEGHHGFRDCWRVADIGLQELVLAAAFERLQRSRVGRIGHGIDVQHGVTVIVDQFQHDSRPDESGAAGYRMRIPDVSCLYSNAGPRSASRGATLSLSERIASSALTGHSMASSGSFHARLRSCSRL